MSVATSLADLLPSEALSGDGATETWLPLGAVPEAVVHPESTEEVATTLRWATANGVGVAPIGTGGRFIGRRTDRPFVVLSTDRLSGVEIYEPADLTVTAKAGTPLDTLGKELREKGQWLPFDPPGAPERTLGGLTASGESGPAWMGYGELRNHVLGLSVVCGDGRTLKLGGRVVKNVAGFDLMKPVVGSRGRLAVITSICVRVFPRPATDRVLVLRGDHPEGLCAAALAVGTAPVLPVSSVLVAPAPFLASAAALLVRLHGAEATVDADQATLERHCGITLEVSDEPVRLSAAARDHASDAAVVLTFSLLPSRLAKGLEVARDLLEGAEIAADTYAGTVRMATSEVDLPAATRLRSAVEDLGGVLSVHTAPGTRELASARSVRSAHEADLIARLERVFDPEGVLWPCRS